MPLNAYVFECNSTTYSDCIKGLFGSNRGWALKVRKGDLCLLHHLEIHLVFMLWRAETDAARNIVPKAWKGRFPFQAKVALASSEIIEVPKLVVNELLLNPDTGYVVNEVVPAHLPNLLKFIDEKTGLTLAQQFRGETPS